MKQYKHKKLNIIVNECISSIDGQEYYYDRGDKIVSLPQELIENSLDRGEVVVEKDWIYRMCEDMRGRTYKTGEEKEFTRVYIEKYMPKVSELELENIKIMIGPYSNYITKSAIVDLLKGKGLLSTK